MEEKFTDTKVFKVALIIFTGLILICATVTGHSLYKYCVDKGKTVEETVEQKEIVEETVKEEIETIETKLDIYSQLEKDVSNLKDGNTKTIERYLGENSNLAYEEISKIFRQIKLEKLNNENTYDKEDETRCNIRIHTLDFENVREDYRKYSKEVRESNVNITDISLKDYVETVIKTNIQSGKYNIYFELEVFTDDNGNYITSNLKRAITGKYYNSLDCDIEAFVTE